MVKIENMGLEEFEGGMVNETNYIALSQLHLTLRRQ